MSPKDVETKPNEKRPIKWYWWVVVIIIVFIMGNSYGKAQIATTETPVAEITTKEVVKEKECDYTDWKTLKAKDEEIFLVAADGTMLAADGITAAYNRDVATMEQISKEIKANNLKLNLKKAERDEIIEKLGL